MRFRPLCPSPTSRADAASAPAHRRGRPERPPHRARARRGPVARPAGPQLHRRGRANRWTWRAPSSAIYVLDGVMHHLPHEDQEQVLEARCDRSSSPGESSTADEGHPRPRPPSASSFTEALDRLAMVGWREPLAYRHHREWGEMLTGLGFKVRMVRVPDVLPVPPTSSSPREGPEGLSCRGGARENGSPRRQGLSRNRSMLSPDR